MGARGVGSGERGRAPARGAAAPAPPLLSGRTVLLPNHEVGARRAGSGERGRARVSTGERDGARIPRLSGRTSPPFLRSGRTRGGLCQPRQELCFRNGCIYIKLGQHIAQLVWNEILNSVDTPEFALDSCQDCS